MKARNFISLLFVVVFIPLQAWGAAEAEPEISDFPPLGKVHFTDQAMEAIFPQIHERLRLLFIAERDSYELVIKIRDGLAAGKSLTAISSILSNNDNTPDTQLISNLMDLMKKNMETYKTIMSFIVGNAASPAFLEEYCSYATSIVADYLNSRKLINLKNMAEDLPPLPCTMPGYQVPRGYDQFAAACSLQRFGNLMYLAQVGYAQFSKKERRGVIEKNKAMFMHDYLMEKKGAMSDPDSYILESLRGNTQDCFGYLAKVVLRREKLTRPQLYNIFNKYAPNQLHSPSAEHLLDEIFRRWEERSADRIAREKALAAEKKRQQRKAKATRQKANRAKASAEAEDVPVLADGEKSVASPVEEAPPQPVDAQVEDENKALEVPLMASQPKRKKPAPELRPWGESDEARAPRMSSKRSHHLQALVSGEYIAITSEEIDSLIRYIGDGRLTWSGESHGGSHRVLKFQNADGSTLAQGIFVPHGGQDHEYGKGMFKELHRFFSAVSAQVEWSGF